MAQELTAWPKLSSQQILRILLLLPPQYEAHKDITSPGCLYGSWNLMQVLRIIILPTEPSSQSPSQMYFLKYLH